MGIRVLRSGLLTTVQDLGRTGYQRYGVPVGGAMDGFALQVANLLVGNDRTAAGLEMTIQGPVLVFERETVVALCGANMSPTLNGYRLPMWKSVRVREGDELRCGTVQRGCRAYLAVAGGINVPMVMGSHATFLRGQIGGHEGRALRAGDYVSFHPPGLSLARVQGRRLQPPFQPVYEQEPTLRFIPGPQADAFTSQAWHVFTSDVFTVSPHSDRMGYRLQGPALESRLGADIVSEAVPPGAVQVPGDGQPIVLLADRQPTGGYTKIATVITVDLPRLAQLKPGERLRFVQTTLEEAHALWRQQARTLIALEEANRSL